jgi:hypothetical protein
MKQRFQQPPPKASIGYLKNNKTKFEQRLKHYLITRNSKCFISIYLGAYVRLILYLY